MGQKELKVAFLLALRSLQRGSRSSVILTILIIGMCFTNMIFLPSMFSGIGQSITKQLVDYEVSNVLVSPKSGEQYITELDATLDLINGMPGVQRASPQYSKGATFKYRQRVLGVSIRAITPTDEKEVHPVNTKMIAGSYLGEGDTGEIIIGKPVAGDASIREEDEFQASLGGVRVGDSITVEYGNGFTKDYRVKGIYSTGWSPVDNGAFVTWTDMEQVEGMTLDKANFIAVRAKPGYTEQFIENELLAYGVGGSGQVQTMTNLLSKSIGKVLQSFAIINAVSLVVSVIITTVVLFIVITIKTLNSRKQIGILKAIGVDKEVIMHNYGFQVIILGIFGIVLGIIITMVLAAYMSVHPIVTPEWSATLYITPWDLLTNSVILFCAAVVAGYVPAYQVSREDIQTAMKVPDMIEISELRKTYQMGNIEVRALDGVTLTIEKGEFLGIMGPSGSGKSTLLHMLGLLDLPTSGRIVIDGLDILKLNDYEKTMFRLYKLGYVFQDYALVPDLTVMENVSLTAMLRKDRTEEQYRKDSLDILKKIGMSDRQDHLPRELSGGQQQRVSLARAMVNKPEILFADEPCANLDTENSRVVLDLFKEINESMKQTIVMVSHEDWHKDYFHRVVRLRDGKIVSDGINNA